MDRKTLIGAVFVGASLALAIQAPAATQTIRRTFSKTTPAAGIKTLKLDVKVGTVNVTTSKTDNVGINVSATPRDSMHFIFDWSSGNGPPNQLPAGMHLVAQRQGDTLVVSMESGASGKSGSSAATTSSDNWNVGSVHIHTDGSGDNNWKGDWTITVPARLALDLKVGVGDLKIHGTAGGLRADVGMGKLAAELAKGPIRANVGMGSLTARVLDDDYGTVSLSAGVGTVAFKIHGKQDEAGYQKEFTSAKQEVNGPGKTSYKLQSGLGSVELDIGVKKLHNLDSGDKGSGDEN